jgi:hypothetical protein
MTNDFVCKSKATALSILDALISSCPGGIQRDALLALRSWMLESFPADWDPETAKRIASIFEGTEAQRKGRSWLDLEMNDPAYIGHGSDHHEFIYEPEDGAELVCAYKAKHKKWIPIGYGWPPVLHRAAEAPGEEG